MVSLTTMYAGQANSPIALLASDINDSATSITVDNGNILPAATTWLTIGADTDDAETVLMTGKSGNVLTVTRGQQGTIAKAWGAGANVQRCFTASDHNVLIDNVNALNGGKAESSHDHTKSQITDFPATMAPSAHKSTHATGGGDALTPADIGAAEKSLATTATILAESWTGSSAPFSYTLSVAGVTTTSVQEILPSLTITAAELESLQAANVQDGGQTAGQITLKAFGDKPTIDLPVRIVLRGDL